MKKSIQLWTLPELFAEVYRRAENSEDIYLIPYDRRFRNSHFHIIRGIVEALKNQENDGTVHKKSSSGNVTYCIGDD
jgi:hypothetical protein